MRLDIDYILPPTSWEGKLNVLCYPDAALRGKARPVDVICEHTRLVVKRMWELLYRHNGVGLAAPQLGLNYRLLVMNHMGDRRSAQHEIVAINPVILEKSGVSNEKEGCLSFPGVRHKIRRANFVRVMAWDLEGKQFEMACSGLQARIWQHEIDHLDGVLFIDKAGTLGRIKHKSANHAN